MYILLIVLGLGLVAVGVVVLLWFPHRPGGRISAAGVEVSSAGAGLPLIALGVICLLIVYPGVPRPWVKDRVRTPGGSFPEATCLDQFFQDVEPQRITRLEVGAQNVQILGPRTSKQDPFGLVFTENGRVFGALKLLFIPPNRVFKVQGLVDAECRPVTDYANTIPGTDKNTLGNWDTLDIKWGDDRLALRLGYDAGIVDALEFRRFSSS